MSINSQIQKMWFGKFGDFSLATLIAGEVIYAANPRVFGSFDFDGAFIALLPSVATFIALTYFGKRP